MPTQSRRLGFGETIRIQNNDFWPLLSLRDFEDDAKSDIIIKYFDDEAKELYELDELPEHIKIAEGGLEGR